MVKFKIVGILTKQNLKILCSYDRLRAHTFHACRKSLRAGYKHDYERAYNFLRPGILFLSRTEIIFLSASSTSLNFSTPSFLKSFGYPRSLYTATFKTVLGKR